MNILHKREQRLNVDKGSFGAIVDQRIVNK